MEHHILHDLHDLSRADIESASSEPTSDSGRALFVLFAFALGIVGFLVFRR